MSTRLCVILHVISDRARQYICISTYIPLIFWNLNKLMDVSSICILTSHCCLFTPHWCSSTAGFTSVSFYTTHHVDATAPTLQCARHMRGDDNNTQNTKRPGPSLPPTIHRQWAPDLLMPWESGNALSVIMLGRRVVSAETNQHMHKCR